MAQQIESQRKISTRAALLLGLLIGFAATAGIYSIATTLAQTSSTTTNIQNLPYVGHSWGPRGGTWLGNGTYGYLSLHAISRVQNVSITGFNITGTNQMIVFLRYTGTGTTPTITVVAASQGLTGSIVQQAGWSSPANITVRLTGTGSLSTSGCGMVLVVPYTG